MILLEYVIVALCLTKLFKLLFLVMYCFECISYVNRQISAPSRSSIQMAR